MAIKNKKGIFFTFMSILLVTALMLAFSSDVYITSKNRLPVVKSRIKTADNYLRSIEGAYLKNALYVSSYSAMESLTSYINQTTGLLMNEAELNIKFKEAVLNGTIDGSSLGNMQGNTFIYRLEEMEEISQNTLHIATNFNKDYENIDIILFQDETTVPWQVAVNLTLDFSVNAEIALWNKTDDVSIIFSIRDFQET
ncbi:hypothetical protein AUJ83_04080 [Candidatus Woesearchaeota archaeon CG1_02_33_12]|nr:MAG: hypothetical protein AUJ83_04080 [Candidatus Woesearchaeota archaeon CG1_02_33_12]PIN79063.1 MAG: hypothetical protein COV14_00980 [Candidatus Woesearchaeota archaeon CG10_big_fil_rev_8_21_14_0_10_33_12]